MTADTQIDSPSAAQESEAAAVTDAPHEADAADAVDAAEPEAIEPAPTRRRVTWHRVVVMGIMPAIALALALGAGYAKWRAASIREAQLAGIAVTQTAKDATVGLLSYRPDTVENDLTAARDRLTGAFRDSYTTLTEQVVIPGARQKLITAVAKVPAAGLVSVGDNHAVVLVFVDQTTTIGNDAPSDTASTVRVSLDKIHGKWLISGFDPV